MISYGEEAMGLVKADTPMMRQFNAMKQAYPDCILFFRSGDFYEMFGEDAKRASDVLQIALTTRNKNTENEVPMCGVPYHAYEQYLNKLTAAGFKVAICEQMEDPAAAKGLVRREVVRVVTPGTTVSAPLLEADQHRYLMAIEPRLVEKPIGVALVDLSTGRFEALEFPAGADGRLLEFLRLESPREVLLPEPRNPREQERIAALRAGIAERLRGQEAAAPHIEQAPAAWFDPQRAQRRLNEQFKTVNLSGFGVERLDTSLRAAGALLAYLSETQKSGLAHLTQIRERQLERRMRLDESSLSHLEVFENPAPGGKRHTLFGVLNQTRTAMGARLLRDWLAHPLLDKAAIEARLEAVEELAGNSAARAALREVFAQIRDLERIIARISLPVAGIADIVALREALGAAQFLPPLLAELKAPLVREIAADFDPMEDIHRYLKERFLEAPCLRIAEGGYIAAGVSPELDHLRELSQNRRAVISRLEAEEREKTGIGSLKIRYNKVFGYYLEISRVHQHKVPAAYLRKQTLVNAERFTTPQLQELEEQILGAEQRIIELEMAQFQSAREILGGYARRMQATARQVALLDVLCALAQVAQDNGYIRPTLLGPESPRRLLIRAGRHPVIERIAFDEPFIPNDVELDAQERQILLITGPNMAGKSTVMRQVALIQLMAQTGSFVPADQAELCLVDRLFTRVGASDNLSRGQSTFMLEMNEAANILNNATPNSLIILDEIGRGTSTFDGISIAWAMVEHLHGLGALTLFATHYHELTQLAQELPRVRNYNVAIREQGEHLVFTRKLIPGEADRSYGIQVARLAGLPAPVIARAHEVMENLTNGAEAAVAAPEPRPSHPGRASTAALSKGRQQLSFLSESHPVVEDLKTLDLDRMTPLDALTWLHRMKARVTKGD
jgi:DNA mismatch repair protein MutS